MNGLIERLRDAATDEWPICSEAADEIKRLRAELLEAREQWAFAVDDKRRAVDDYVRVCEKLSAANRGLDLYKDVYDELYDELEEQCRLNGCGSEREAKLKSENDALRAELAAVLNDMAEIQQACGLHVDEYAPGSAIEYIKETEQEAAELAALKQQTAQVPAMSFAEVRDGIANAVEDWPHNEYWPPRIAELIRQIGPTPNVAPQPSGKGE